MRIFCLFLVLAVFFLVSHPAPSFAQTAPFLITDCGEGKALRGFSETGKICETLPTSTSTPTITLNNFPDLCGGNEYLRRNSTDTAWVCHNPPTTSGGGTTTTTRACPFGQAYRSDTTPACKNIFDITIGKLRTTSSSPTTSGINIGGTTTETSSHKLKVTGSAEVTTTLKAGTLTSTGEVRAAKYCDSATTPNCEDSDDLVKKVKRLPNIPTDTCNSGQILEYDGTNFKCKDNVARATTTTTLGVSCRDTNQYLRGVRTNNGATEPVCSSINAITCPNNKAIKSVSVHTADCATTKILCGNVTFTCET